MPDDQAIFAISDLHLGDGGPRDNSAFGGHRVQLPRFLDHVATQGGELVILGDLFEFWQSSFSRVVVYNVPLLDRLAQLKTTYVLGNHDADLAGFVGTTLLSHPFFSAMCGPFTRVIGGRRFKFMHGHEVDPFNSGENPSWGRMLAIFAGIFEEQNGSPMLPSGQPVEEVLSGFGEHLLRFWNWLVNRFQRSVSGGKSPSPKHELTPAQNPDRAVEMLAKYAADRDKEGYDVAVVGHTHCPGRIADWYVNTGSWVTTQNNFVRILPSRQVELYDWVDGQPVPNDTVLQQ